MGLIQVTSAQLKSKAEELKSLNANFKSTVGELESTESQLNGQWDGEANDAFHAAFERDKIQMNNFYNAIEVYIQKLLEIAQNYEKAEAANTEVASSRTY